MPDNENKTNYTHGMKKTINTFHSKLGINQKVSIEIAIITTQEMKHPDFFLKVLSSIL